MRAFPVGVAILVAIAGGAFVACGGGENDAGSQHYQSQEWGFAFDYPPGWDVLSPQEAQERVTSLLPQSKLAVVLGDSERRAFAIVGVQPASTAPGNDIEEIGAGLEQQSQQASEGIRLEGSQFMDLQGTRAFDYTISFPSDTASARDLMRQVMAFHADDFYAMAFVSTEGDYPSFQAAFDAILASFRWPDEKG